MLTLALYGLLAIVVIAALFLVLTRFLPAGEQIAPPIRDQAPWGLPDRPLRAQDVATVRLPVALRGYRFAETDRLLDRITEELRARDDEIARLRGESSGGFLPPAAYAPATFDEPDAAAPPDGDDGER